MRARFLVAPLLIGALLSPAAKASEAAWAMLRQPGHLVLMRHATAPGLSEEAPGIDLKNCALQRNLDETGRAQARRIGDAFRRHGIRQVRLLSSRYCRCLETSRLLNLGPVGELALLNYFNFNDPTRTQIEAEKSIAHLKTLPTRPLPVLVTHVSNIKAMTGITPNSGEMVVVRFEADKLVVAGRIESPN